MPVPAPLLRKGFARGDVATAFTETTRITANLVLNVLGSTIFSDFVVQTGMAQSVVKSIAAVGLPPLAVTLLLIAFYVFFGCFLEGIGLVLVTVPVLLQLVISTGYDPIWFGGLLGIVVEIGLIHHRRG
jgi:TRAP-type C4-dicarboxylate transport system permease large subunit